MMRFDERSSSCDCETSLVSFVHREIVAGEFSVAHLLYSGLGKVYVLGISALYKINF